jgi:hypothetical protein
MQRKETSKKEWKEKKRISAREYDDILHDFDFNLYLRVFSGVLPQARGLLDVVHHLLFDL